jgi:hypothetical protein
MLLLAEVMDKEPTLPELFLIPVIVGVFTFLLIRWSRWFFFPAFLLSFLLGWAVTSEVRDPYVGPAIVREAGYYYIWCAYVAASTPAVLALLGLIFSRKHLRNSEPN